MNTSLANRRAVLPIAALLALALALTLSLPLGGCANRQVPADSSEQANAPAFQGDLIISAQEALGKVGSDDVIMVDCTGNAGAGTVEGAIALVWQDLSTCGAEYGESSDEGWGKIPEPADLAQRLGAYGLDKSKQIICLGHTTSGWGDDGRVAWTLRAAGYTDVKLVDGGIDALLAAGAPKQNGGSEPVPCQVQVDSIDLTHVMQTDELLAHLADYKVVDTRAIEEYDGATYYGEKKGGHIPGAIHIDYLSLFRQDGTLKSNDQIVALFQEAGIAPTDKVVTYCTGGIRSAYVQMVLEMCGFQNTMNYDQSYWRWCAVGDVEQSQAQAA